VRLCSIRLLERFRSYFFALNISRGANGEQVLYVLFFSTRKLEARIGCNSPELTNLKGSDTRNRVTGAEW
jgi:hypothetical protein